MNTKKLFLFSGMIWAGIIAAHIIVCMLSLHWSFVFAAIDSLIHNSIVFLSVFGLFWLNKYFHETLKEKKWMVVALVFAFLISVSFWYIVRAIAFNQLILPISTVDHEFLIKAEIPRLIIATLEIMIGGGFLFLLNQIDEIKSLTERETALKETLKQTQLNALKWQINPHFLFNSLNSISSLTITSPSKAHEMVLKLGELLRHSLKADIAGLVSVKEELHLLSLYTDIEKIRFGDRLQMNIKSDEEIENMKMPSMLLQPLIENAVKHGVNSREDGATINLTFSVIENMLNISITNPYDKSGRKSGSRTGLSNIADRMTLVYGTRNLMQVRDTGQEFLVELKIPN